MFNIIALAVAALASPPQHEHAAAQAANKVRFGKYEAELRIPEGGLFAREETDVEFRVVDTTQKDPVEEGFKGVGAIEATAKVSMPAMAGMPSAEPKVHREGVPGDYGIELYFPHGGDYQIDLTLNIPNDGVHKIAFKVSAQDERAGSVNRSQPYRLDVIDWPKNAKAGQKQSLKLRVIDTKTGKAQTEFDIAHERDFHLLIASRDLNWFVHEHPVMKADGTWTIDMVFPAGGTYGVYGDVAPKGMGSRILVSKVTLTGPKPTWSTKLVPSVTATDRGLKAIFAPVGDIRIGRTSTLQVKLFDQKTGMPASDTVPWLGAAGHMMIFHQDAQTVVHSHPSESEENSALVKQGIVRFSARFPKAGLYKIYAQFDWRGKVRTVGFVVKIKENS
jgi:hypothetical protein